MKKNGILNARLSYFLAALGHKDLFLIGDAGMPIPKGVPIIDLAVCCGIPGFFDVFDAIIGDAVVEHYTLANEIKDYNPSALAHITHSLAGVEHDFIEHNELKKMSQNVKFAVRTGEATPYPNIILRAGVSFPV